MTAAHGNTKTSKSVGEMFLWGMYQQRTEFQDTAAPFVAVIPQIHFSIVPQSFIMTLLPINFILNTLKRHRHPKDRRIIF